VNAAHPILVVEDDPAMREMVVDLLEEEGLRTVAASDSEKALDALCCQHFAAMLSDVRMAGRGGLALLREVHRRWPDLKVVMMTAFGNLEDANRAVRAGASDLVSKPFKRSELLAALARVLEP